MFKKSALVALLCLSVSAFASSQTAGSTPVPQGTDALTLVQGRLVDVQTRLPNCPPHAMCEAVSVARIEFTIGCLDKLAPVTVSSEHESGKITLNVTAFSLANEESRRVLCTRANTQSIEVFLGMGFYSKDDVQVRFAQQGYVAR